MKKQFHKSLSLVLAVFMLISTLGGIVPHAHAASFTSVKGWYETIIAEISGISDSNVTGVSYSGTSSGSLKGEDLEFLVRNTSGGVRIDIPGVKAGNYSLTVTTSSGTLTASDINVAAYDRSGYAHWNNTEGVGAYNDDGTLKSNAIVLYVTDSNKNSVSVTSKDGTTVTGIGNILNTAGMDTGSGSTSKGGKPNTNKDILRKLAADGTPLVVRIVGSVSAPSGVTAYDSVDYGGSTGDNGYMVRMRDAKNITIEGIGNDAVINGWGMHFMATANYSSYGKNFEVRNISFKNVPEDCVGMEGEQSGSTLNAPVERCWVHHCAFYGPSISNPAESDKDGGDGACDFKRGQYFTNSYCYYEGYHKTNLVGASDSNMQYHLTYHHNYWKDCESRGPLARMANIHMYNNVFDGQTSYCQNPRANAYIFSEYNLFTGCKDPVEVTSGGVVKSYNDTYDNCRGNMQAEVVTSKSTKVSNSCKYSGFELSSSMGYVADNDYALQTSISASSIRAAAGPMTDGSTTSPESGGSSGGEADPDATTTPTTSGGTTIPAGSYVHNFTENAKVSDFYTINGNLTKDRGTVTYNGLSLTQGLKMESSTTISFTAPSAGTLTLVFGGSDTASSDQFKLNGTSTSINSSFIYTGSIAAGSHTITKDDTCTLYYMVYTSDSVAGGESEETTAPTDAHTHSYSSSVTTAATCGKAGVMTYTCSCGDSYTEAIPATGNHSYSNGSCTVCGAADPNYVAPTEPTQPGHSHSYSKTVTAPSCEAAGYTTYTCSCGDSYVGDYVAATGHSYANGKCSVCGAADPNAGTSSGGGSTTGGGTGSITEAGGRLESAYVEWNAVSGASGYNVYVRKISGSYVQLDTELIRNYGSYWRADALGLSAGTYCMKVVPIISGSPNESKSMVTTALEVKAHNRDGYAHTNGSVGAYNNDGTLKSGAVVVYVTDSNVDSVKATIGGTTYTGLQSILYDSRKTSGTICVRIIGEIDIPSKTTSGQIQIKENQSAITVEGVGEDATCNGWGITLSTAENVEIRNLGFMNNASSEGDNVTLQKCNYCWVHNCDFFYGTDRGGDKNKGDGALDTKESKYITHSYNHFWDCGKCNLQGSGTGDTSDNITYHHNWYDHSDSRHPRVRVATVHVYNNYYDGVAKYGIGNAYKAEVISEGNYFRNTKNPMLTSTQGSDVDKTMSGETPGTLTSYNDYVTGATSWIPNVSGIEGATSWSSSDYDCIIVNTRFSGYSYELQSAADAKATVIEYAGRMNGSDFEFEFTAADDTDYERNSKLDAALTSYSTSLKSVGGNSVSASTSNDGPASDDSSHTHTYVSSTTTSATCTTTGVVTYTCDCGTSYTSTIPALGHSYANGVCTRCGAEETTGGDTTEPTTPSGGGTVTAGSYVHNFTENAKVSDFYTINGNLTKDRGTVTYNGLSLTQGLKMESSTTISFTAPSAGTLTLVFGGSDTASSDQFKLNGTSTSINSSFIYTGSIAAGSYTITKDDTCTLYYMVYTPESSGEEEHTHSYSSSVTTAATCGKAGVMTYTCSCGSSYTEEIPATGNHSYSSVVTAPNCTEQGFTTHTCSVCGNSYVDSYTAANGHSYTNGYCTVCGAADPGYAAPTDPTEEPTEPTEEPSQPSEPAVSADAKIHNFTDDGFSSDFYTFAGSNLTNGKHGTYTYDFGSGTETLNNALKLDSAGSVVFIAPADGTLTIAAASQSGGRSGIITDGTATLGTVDVAAANTLYVLTVDVTANTQYTVKRSSGEIGLYYIAYIPESTGGDVHTHSYSSSVTTAATCGKAGVMTYTCSCGDSYTEEIPATGNHSYSSSVVAPGCETEGSTVYTCSVCGDSYSESIPATGHSHEAVVTAPSCTEQGYTTYTCACGDSYVADYVAATGHSHVKTSTVEPSCTEDGYDLYECACGDYYMDPISATGHSYEAVVTAPDCVNGGYTTYTCSCGDSYVADEVDALGHTDGEAVIENEVAASCTEAGSYDTVTYCTVCGVETGRVTTVVEALGHSHEAVVTAPGCETQGYTTYTCSCGDSYVADYVAATGHNYGSDGVCSNCGQKDPNATPPLFLFSIAGANMALGNDLTMYFYVNKADVESGNYYMQITKTYADGRADVVRKVDFDDWTSYGNMYRVGFDGIAAKEMSDKIHITVYTDAGAAASYTKVTTVTEYAVSLLSDNSAKSAKCHTLMADMLNYGAAAQTLFNYNTGNLANSVMTSTHANKATAELDMTKLSNNSVKGTGFAGGTLTLESNISLNFYFDAAVVDKSMTAKISYTDHYGIDRGYTISGSDFVVNGNYIIVSVDTLVAADAYQLVTVEIYDSNNALAASGVTSIESIAALSYETTPLYVDLMKFCISAHTYFHS